MTRSQLTLLGGACAVLAGAFSIVLSLLYLVLIATVWASNLVPEYMVGSLRALAMTLLSLLFTLGLAGVYALFGRRSWLGISGLSLSCLSILAAVSPVVFTVLSFLYHAVVTHKQVVSSPGLILPSLAVDLVRDALLAGAILLLAVAALQERNPKWWTPLPFLLAGLTLLPVLGYFGIGPIPFGPAAALAILRGPCWMLLGGVLWVRALGRRNFAYTPPSRS